MKEILLRHWVRIAIATLLMVALWALKTRAFVSLPGIDDPQKYNSFGKIPAHCLTASLALAFVMAAVGLRRLTILFTGISLGFYVGNLMQVAQDIADMAAMAEDTDSQSLISLALEASHLEPGFWILSFTLAAAAILALFPVPTRMRPRPD